MGAQGTTTVDFGAFPGACDAAVAVIGQAAILAGSQIEAYLYPSATADHSADEHLVEAIRIYADPSTIIVGTGFTIKGFALDNPGTGSCPDPKQAPCFNRIDGVRLYGQYTVAWVWN